MVNGASYSELPDAVSRFTAQFIATRFNPRLAPDAKEQLQEFRFYLEDEDRENSGLTDLDFDEAAFSGAQDGILEALHFVAAQLKVPGQHLPFTLEFLRRAVSVYSPDLGFPLDVMMNKRGSFVTPDDVDRDLDYLQGDEESGYEYAPPSGDHTTQVDLRELFLSEEPRSIHFNCENGPSLFINGEDATITLIAHAPVFITLIEKYGFNVEVRDSTTQEPLGTVPGPIAKLLLETSHQQMVQAGLPQGTLLRESPKLLGIFTPELPCSVAVLEADEHTNHVEELVQLECFFGEIPGMLEASPELADEAFAISLHFPDGISVLLQASTFFEELGA